MVRGRYILLEETCAASEIESMMGRVVRDVRLPLGDRFAPEEPLDNTEPRRNPQDILPSILPPPIATNTRKDIVEAAVDRGVKVALTSFFGIDLAKTQKERVELESEEVKRYSLKQPHQVFEYLQKDTKYAKDVEALVSDTWKGKAFMVVGFLTASGALWKVSKGTSLKTGFNFTLPLSFLAGAPAGLDPSVNPSQEATDSNERTMTSSSEEIFAIAYCTVKLRRYFAKDAKKYLGKRVAFGGNRRAKASEPSLGDSDEEQVDEEPESEEEDYEFAENLPAGLSREDVRDINDDFGLI